MQNSIHYRVSSSHPASHYFDICLTIAEPNPAGQSLWLPDWIPGSYMIRDFARHLSPLQAFTHDGQPVAVQALDKSSWRCAPVNGELTVNYRVYAWDLSVRSALLDQFGGFFNGTSLFVAVEGQEERSIALDIVCPTNIASMTAWRVATTLPRAGADALGFGGYCAANYDELIDHPVEMGVFDYETFVIEGVVHAIAITGMHRGDTARLVADVSRICAEQIRFFDEPAPFSEYLFLLRVVGTGYGGLEHRCSTSLMCSREGLPAMNEPIAPSAGYTQLLGLCSHEYFHSWQVKRLKPLVMVKPNLRAPVHSELLWFFEGFTAYYDDQFLLRAGVIDVDAYGKLLAQTISRYVQSPGRHVQTVAASSFDAWTKYYQQNENTPNAVVSYYLKGALIALCLDLMLRAQGMTLDQIMRELWQRFGRAERGITQADIVVAVSAKLGEYGEQFLHHALYTTQELPWQCLLEDAGIKVTLSASTAVSVGARIQAADGGVLLRVVDPAGTAAAAGLSAGDMVVAIDKLRINAASWDKRLAQYAAGDCVSVYAFRRDEWQAFECRIAAAEPDSCSLECLDNPTTWPSSLLPKMNNKK